MNVNEILEMNIFKVWMKFVLASVVGVVLNTIYSIVDGMFVGQGVGEAGLASVNIVWPAVTVIIGTGLMIGIGTSNKISVYLGKGDNESAEKYLATSIKFIIAIGIIIMSVAFIFREKIIVMLGATPDTIDYVREYYTIMYLMTIPYLFSTALNPIVRADGNPNLSMMMIGIGAVANIILDYIFVMKLGLEVKGAAMATSASIFISMTVSLYYFIKGNAKIKFKLEYFKLNKNIIENIVKVGFVSLAIQLSYGLILFVQNISIYKYGTTVDVAIYTVAAYIIAFIANTFMGIAQGLQPIIGYHRGANKYDRINKLMKLTFTICIIVGILFYIGIILFGKNIIYVFGIDPSNIDSAYQMLLMYCIASPIMGIVFTMGGYYQVMGKNLYSNILYISRGFVFQFILTLILPPVIGIWGIFLSLPVSEIITFLILGILVLIDRRKEKINEEKSLTEAY